MVSGTVHAEGHHHLHVHGHSVVHRMGPEAKVAGLGLFVVAVALTPRTSVGSFLVDGLVAAVVLAIARLPIRLWFRRLVVLIPFVAFAVFVPFVAGGRQVEVAGIGLSTEGLWATWNILAKAMLGTTASIIVSATTPIPDLLKGLSRLHLPAVFVSIVAFMFRYLDVLVDQFGRMRNAMTARGHDPRWLWQAKPIASSAGALFVRSYERGERIHHAMLARGFDGVMPTLETERATKTDWLIALIPGTIAVLALIAGLVWPV